MSGRVAIIGAGWSGAVTARQLHDAGLPVEVFEKSPHVGGHARFESLNGVYYEPNGAHIFHTSNPRVANYVRRFGLVRPYEHKVLTEVYLDEDDEESYLLSWPPQIEELRGLRVWPTVERELAELPAVPSGEDFESYVVSLMGPTLYRIFIRDYTLKQWGRPAAELSNQFAQKRVELRDDGYRRLFRDTWECFPNEGYNGIIEAILAPIPVTSGVEMTIEDMHDLAQDFSAVVITGALDDFLARPTLEWRGIRMRSRYVPTQDETGTVTAAYVVNYPSLRVPYTRTVETKHATGQRISGTVVSYEFPGAQERHYPVPTVDRRFEMMNEQLKTEIREKSPIPIFFTGRLANYTYINQDQAIEAAFDCSAKVLATLGA